MPGSRVPVAFFVDDGALMIVASTIVPVLTVMPWARRWSRTASNRVWPSPCCSSRWRNLQTVVSSGTGSRPRSIPTNARIVGESYSASSTAGSERLNQCWRQYIRSIRSTPTGGRPFPGWGYTGSIRAPSSRHGTTRSISARNCARRVTFVYFSNPVLASVGCERVIATSRSCVRLLVASQHNSRERERLIQSFLSFRLVGWTTTASVDYGSGRPANGTPREAMPQCAATAPPKVHRLALADRASAECFLCQEKDRVGSNRPYMGGEM